MILYLLGIIMSKKFIKLNINDNHLSLGNLFRIIKELAKNKTSALQVELFCTLFKINDINYTTVNNYCLGARSIGSDYKQIFLNKEKRYQKDKEEFADTIINLLSIIDGTIYTNISNKIDFINNNTSAIYLAKKLYNLAKNDQQISNDFTNNLQYLLKSNQIYECLVQELLFIVIDKKQPIYEDILKKEVLESILNDTSISSSSLEEYLSLKLREGINFDFKMKKLANNGNAYANYELGCNEFYGYVKGVPRYDEAFTYLKNAADYNHASACYMISRIYIEGFIGNKSNEELEMGYKYLLKAIDLGNIAALNYLGNMYYEGIYPLKKDEDKAYDYFIKASNYDYAYALNNLGKIALKRNDYKTAFDYFLKSANLGESWACNQVGEFYRQGIIIKDMKKAYKYYNNAILGNYQTTCFYAYYNLAKYFLLNGYENIKKDYNKAISYLEIAKDNNILPAIVLLFTIKAKNYKENKSSIIYNELLNLKVLIENHNDYNNVLRNNINSLLNDINNKKSINLALLD